MKNSFPSVRFFHEESRNSARVEKALASKLGYPSFEALKAAGRRPKGGAA